MVLWYLVNIVGMVGMYRNTPNGHLELDIATHKMRIKHSARGVCVKCCLTS